LEKKVLIIEFDRHEAQPLGSALARHGYRPLAALTGARGLELFRAEAPDFVFVNYLMPDLQGADIIQRLRSRADGAKVPIYVISQISHANETLFKRMGADGRIAKPINLGEALAIVEKHLGPATAPAEPGESPARPKPAAGQAEAEKSEGVPSRGSLKALPFHQLLAQIYRGRESGVLRLKDEKGQMAITFHQGCPNLVETEGFTRRLARDGVISDREAQLVRRRAAEEGIPAPRVLAEMKLIEPERLQNELREYGYATLRDLCQARSTRFLWEPGETAPQSPLDPSVVIELAAKRHFPAERVVGPLEAKGRMAKPMFLASDPTQLPDLAKRPATRDVAEAARRNDSLAELLRRTAEPIEDIQRAAYALALLKVITFDPKEAWTAPSPERAAPAVSRPEPTPPPAPANGQGAATVARARPTPPSAQAPAAAAGSQPAPEDDRNAELSDENLLRLGKQFLHEKAFSKAQRCFAELLEHGRENDPRVLTLLASAVARNRFADNVDRAFKSVDLLRRALEVDPRHVEARLELARILGEAGHADLARAELREQLAVTPDHEELQRELRILERRERRAE